jgi:hypothetical protein
MTLMRILLATLVCAGIGVAQSSTESADTTTPEGMLAAQKTGTYEENHIIVVPNYSTVNDPDKTYTPLTVGEKFFIAAHDSFDPFNWVITGAYAAVYQKENQYKGFGQGGAGYAKRYGAVFADGAISTYFSEAFLPSILHEDPRFFRLGEGTKFHRIGYALTRVLVTKTDAGTWRFNNSEIFGNMIAAGISNLYYPAANRTVGCTFEKFGIGVISDAGFNVLKEFWPDMKHKVLHR